MAATQDAINYVSDVGQSDYFIFKPLDHAEMNIFVHNAFHTFQIIFLPWNSRIKM